MIRKASSLDYAFSVGKIRALENFLIPQATFEQALSLGLDEALKLFVESDLYGDALLQVKDSRHLEAVLSQELAELKKTVSNLLLDKGLLRLLDLADLKAAQDFLRSFGSKFLSDYFSHLIDLHNLKTFLRLYLLKEPREKPISLLTCEGFIKKEDFLKLYEDNLEALLYRLKYVHQDNSLVDYAYFLSEPIRKLESENSFVALEKAINDFLIYILRPAKYFVFGPEPVLAYYFAKANEINLMRLIILTKLNNLTPELAQERLSITYA